jgi:serine/threonine protein kinase
MTPDRWKRITELFEAALERPPEGRVPFLQEACHRDRALCNEVKRLLDEHEKTADFLQRPPIASSADLTMVLGGAVQPTLSAGELLDHRYRVGGFIGRGGMGEVYEAEDVDLRVQIALKVIRPEIAADARAIARFKREIQLARKVTHPNVCRIFDVGYHGRVWEAASGTTRGLTFLTMELLRGETLSARLRRAGRLSTQEALPMVEQMAAGLAAAHQAGVVHRDFKSANVMLVPTAGGRTRIVVMDFGLARSAVVDPGTPVEPVPRHSVIVGEAASESVTSDGVILGTPEYMAPEQVEGKPVDAAADVYALGVVMYQMVTGTLPFLGDSPLSTGRKRLSEPPLSPRIHVPDLDKKWEMAILRCLNLEPTGRFRSATDVVKALGEESETVQLLPHDVKTLELLQRAYDIRQAEATKLREAVSDAVHHGGFEQAIELAENAVREFPDDPFLGDLFQLATELKLRLGETLGRARKLLESGDPRAATVLLDAAPEFVSNNDEFRKLSAESRAAGLDRALRAKKLHRRKNLANVVSISGFWVTAFYGWSLWQSYLEGLPLLMPLFSLSAGGLSVGCGLIARYLISRNVTLLLGTVSRAGVAMKRRLRKILASVVSIVGLVLALLLFVVASLVILLVILVLIGHFIR